MYAVRFTLLVSLCFLCDILLAQCPTASGDGVSYGVGSWIGYVYDGIDNFSAANYQGTITETANFNESFCGDNCNFTASTGCNVNTETFTVRFKMQQTFACGTYLFTIGGDDGVRLSIDGGSTFLINDYSDHAYRTVSGSAYLAGGTYNLVLEYYENSGQNQVSFSSSFVIAATGGTVGSDQNICQAAPIDPAAFTNIGPAIFCSGATPNYQWEDSPNASAWSSISGATSLIYDIPSGFSTGTRYYRRRADDGAGLTVYSNVLTVIADSPQGDQNTYGTDSWIGYVYDGVNNYTSSNYYGYFTEAAIFDESFCGNTCTFTLNGCDIYTETFTVRLKMRITLASAGYTFTIGADDGVRLSINGGSTYLLNDYSDHGYRTVTSSVVNLNGTYDFILEFYENGGGNRVSFSYSAGPLPVTWSYFDGHYKDGHNVIEWETASEESNKGFEIEQSINATQFSKIGWIEGNGTTLIPNRYVFVDSLPAAGWNYYRLKQIDFDGKSETSRVIPVFTDQKNQIQFYPNPAQDYIFVSGLDRDTDVTFMITDMVTHKSLILQQDIVQPSRFKLNNATPGIYLAQIKMNAIIHNEKLIIAK